MELKGSRTEAALWQAFADECKARTSYEFFASQARKDGYQQIAALFDETARNEKEQRRDVVQGTARTPDARNAPRAARRRAD